MWGTKSHWLLLSVSASPEENLVKKAFKSIHLNLEMNEHIMWKQEFQIFTTVLSWNLVRFLRGSSAALEPQTANHLAWYPGQNCHSERLLLFSVLTVMGIVRTAEERPPPCFTRFTTVTLWCHPSSVFAKESWCCTWKRRAVSILSMEW